MPTILASKSATKATSDKAEKGELSDIRQQTFLGFKIKPRPAGFAEGKEIPQDNINFISGVLFSWLTPLLRVGVSRPFEIDDFWELTDEFRATRLAIELEKNFYDRVPPSRRPLHLRPANAVPVATRDVTDIEPKGMELKDIASGVEVDADNELTGDGINASKNSTKNKIDIEDEKERTHPEKIEEDGKVYDQNLLLAIHRTVMWRFWTGGMLGVCWIALTSTSPLISRKILNYITESYEYSHRLPGENLSVPKSVGYGIGVSFALYFMQQISSLFMNSFLQRGLITGFMLRAAVISVVSRKSVRLSGEARMVHTNGKLVTHISSDASFMDYAALLTHELYLQPAQVIVGLIILLHTIGYSALVGFAVLVIGIPFQAWLFSQMIGTRQRQMKIVDSRVRLLQEVLSGIRVIKFMAYEEYFGSRISDYRQAEMNELRKNCLMRAIMSSVMAFIPVFAAVLSFITYSLSGHELNAAIIFTALQSFNNIRQPLQLIPIAIQAVSDAYVGLGRVSLCLLADEIDNPVPVYPDAKYAISSHGDYSWESAEKPSDEPIKVPPGKGGPMGKGKPLKKSKKERAAEKEERRRKTLERLNTPPVVPFALKNIDLDIPRGSFVVVCGRVGSGKSSLMQALLGEMKLVSGEAYLGGTSAYFPQSPWILNATLKENILFGSEMNDLRFNAAIKACALESDIAMLNHGIYTEIGEKGINISGGQKARVCLARAVYCGNEINFFDDPLSAVDAHVSKLLVDGLVNGPLRSKTRILITHHLEVLPKADLIITMVDGRIAEKGTYQELLAANGALAKLMAEHMSVTNDEGAETIVDLEVKLDASGLIDTQEDFELDKAAIEDGLEEKHNQTRTNENTAGELAKSQAPGALVTMKEERAVGAVSSKVYKRYIDSMGSVWWAVAFLSCFIVAQACIVGNTIFLGKWSETSISGWSQGQYMGLYAGLGLAYSILTFIGSFILFLSAINASFNLFNSAYDGVMATPVSWFDATPIGRIVSRLSKDITTLDDQLPMQWNTFLTMSLNVFGTIALVFYSFPYLGLIFIPMLSLYYIAAVYYRASSREAKRLDSIFRSTIYAQFGESLSGLSSIRAYGVEDRFVRRIEAAIDVENKCYFIVIALQRWLGVRLAALGNLLVLGVSLFGVGFRNNTSPAKLGVVLTYSLSMSQIFAQIVNIFAQVEQDMNTAERVAYYADLPSEAVRFTSEDPPESWPSSGAITFRDVVLKYRADLPPVLKGLTFSVSAGEKIGVVGRTGAGKSSLLQALFRMVELTEGSIEVDGVDIRNIGLTQIRRKLGIVPQDPLLWNGTVASNLDPEETCTPEQLLSALKRTHLIASVDSSVEVDARLKKFKLDAMVQDDGSNFSAGERQLVALARVVVRDSKIVILDEATSSVDVETDALIQDTIKNEFNDKTVITIAHRLATIAFYDRILVMDAGQVAEYAPPVELFDKKDSIFRSMCDQAQITRLDILRIRGESV